jgi:formate dehydrogenase subunit gamma
LEHEFGYIAPEMVPILATELNISRADVHGVITFYTDFALGPAAQINGRMYGKLDESRLDALILGAETGNS